ncbi:kinase-like protein [Obba rivulosa]|uniref:Kinase-like protein n=1 Tax=Obba rivulosa TaxID=1052685 RepID=A0A8E2DTW2_9APHY|nr:kinase-like protein [Obba rivulosa]
MACFPSLNLLVKFGPNLNIAEEQCLRAVRGLLGDTMPVPEVYGWRQDGNKLFIYMEHVHGVTLEDCWPELSRQERFDVCDQLHAMLSALRTLKQDPRDTFIGAIGRQPLRDIILHSCSKSGPFADVRSFHDAYSWLKPSAPDPSTDWVSAHPMRPKLIDDIPIVFTHGDLHPSNIVVSPADARVLAIVDWHQSGWLPAYWEFCKALWVGKMRRGDQLTREWDAECLPRILGTLLHMKHSSLFLTTLPSHMGVDLAEYPITNYKHIAIYQHTQDDST